MAWFKVDDGFPTHPKVLRIPRAQRLAAIGLWTIAGAWSSKHLTDGAIPAYMLEEWGADVSHGIALVDVGLWVETEDGYRFHDWADSQPSRVEVTAKREADRRRKEAWRAKKAEKSGQSHADVTNDVTTGHQRSSALPDPTHPDPTRPVPKGTSSVGAARRGTRLPDDWEPGPLLIEWARAKAPSVDAVTETERFRDYWRAKAGSGAVKVDWDATWRGWMGREHDRRVERGWRPGSGGDPYAGMRQFGGPVDG